MALWQAGEYGLQSRDNVTSSNLSCIHVKLTDAALKVIEDLQNGNRLSRPTIEISDEKGVIRIPDGRGYKEFVFSVTALPGDPSGSNDCIKQARNGKLETLDSMTQKIVVQATDDVYQTTRDKLAVKNEESMKSRAKEIDQTKTGVKSKKITKRIKNGAALPSRTATNSSQSSIKPIAATRNDWSPAGRSPTSMTVGSTHNTSPPLATSTVTTAPQASATYTTSNRTSSAAKKLDQLKRKNKSKQNNAAKEAALARNKITNGQSKSEKEKMKQALLSVPLRERVVHILGAKPHLYDTPNVMLRLKTEGLNPSSDSTIAELTRLLDAVGSTNSKGCWSLKPQCLGELNPNWNYYSDTDKQLVSRLLAKAKPVVAVHPTHPNLPDTSKRKSEERDDDDLPFSKRSKLDNDEVEEAQCDNTVSDDLMDRIKVPKDYLRDYKAPKSLEQRNKFRDDFNASYEEYIRIWEKEDKYNQKYFQMQQKFNNMKDDSKKKEKYGTKIKDKIRATMRNKEWVAHRTRLQYLQEKLSHIKELVHEFDENASHYPGRPPPLHPDMRRPVVLPE